MAVDQREQFIEGAAITALQRPFSVEERRELEAIYRQQIGAVKALARLLGYPCPIASRQERRNPVHPAIDERGVGGILETTALYAAADVTEC